MERHLLKEEKEAMVNEEIARERERGGGGGGRRRGANLVGGIAMEELQTMMEMRSPFFLCLLSQMDVLSSASFSIFAHIPLSQQSEAVQKSFKI
jgi:hypothetical protein